MELVSISHQLWGSHSLLAAVIFTPAKTVETNYVIFKVISDSKSYKNYIQLK